MIASESPVTVLDDYSPTTDFGPFPNCTQVTLKLTGPNAATVQIFKGFQGSVDNLPEFTLTSPGYFSYAVHALGFRIKNAVAGSAAAYEAQAWFPDDPIVTYQVGGVGPFNAAAGLQYGGPNPFYGPFNVGAWLSIETTTGIAPPGNRDGMEFTANTGSIFFETQDVSGGGASGFFVNVDGDNNAGFQLETSGINNNGINLAAQSTGNSGVSIFGFNGGPIKIEADGGGDIEIIDTGVFGGSPRTDAILVQTTQQNAGTTIKATNAHGNTPRLEIFGPVGGGAGVHDFYLGNDVIAIKHENGFQAINVYGGVTSTATALWPNILLLPNVGADGSTATHPENSLVMNTGAFQLQGLSAEPTTTNPLPDAVLYCYNDGSGHPKLKVYFPITGTRTTLATA